MSLKDKVLSKLGMEEDEDFGIEDIAAISLKFENAVINRKDFLQEILQEKYPQETIDRAISETPSAAGIPLEELKEIAEQLLTQAETNVTSASKIDSLKETLTDEDSNILQKAKGTVDTLQENRYRNEWIRLAQKLLYLYGFPEIRTNDDGMICGDVSKLLVMFCFANMFGVENAGAVLKAFAKILPEIEDKKLSTKQLDSDAISKVLTAWGRYNLGFGLVGVVANHLPIVGRILHEVNYDDGLKEACDNLLNTLSDTALSNPQHKASPKELVFAEKLLEMVQD